MNIKIEKIEDARDLNTVRICSACKSLMIDGFYNEVTEEYFCIETCMDKRFTPKEKKDAIESEEMFYTQWFDIDVFKVFDNQYVHYKDALFIQQKYGNFTTKIYACGIDLSSPIFTIIDGEQVEILN